ncbi:tyrosine-type recombinase/integrase [Methylobacillus caricis]|uniref:tyrosine-type recombinase/integrase n=1 Tax=Methylobacillus caricis TaxID=1971611 RepID=UPI001CFF6B0D|nr:tyrosine-type recombinase/integrase [Methylobacillus caricis]MCB5187413.1 tyrosine-type recombinase/integrase [Methylobacillus caricis]
MSNDVIDRFLEYKLVNQKRSARTGEVYKLVLSRFQVFMGNKSLHTATSDDLVAFAGPWLHKQGVKPGNRRIHVVNIREFFSWMKKTGLIKRDPALMLQAPSQAKRIPRIITLENAERLMWAPDVSTFKGLRDSAMIAMLIGCGLRASGLVSLNESQLIQDRIDDRIRLLIRVTEKGDKERKVPLPQEADLLLRMYLEHPDLKDIDRALPDGDRVLFVSITNRTVPAHEFIGEKRRLNRKAVWSVIKRYGQLLDIPEDQIHPHALRHLFGTELAEDDVDILVRQNLMGHADPKNTKIYTNLAMRKLTRESDRANPLTKMKTPVSDILKRLEKKP